MMTFIDRYNVNGNIHLIFRSQVQSASVGTWAYMQLYGDGSSDIMTMNLPGCTTWDAYRWPTTATNISNQNNGDKLRLCMWNYIQAT